MGAKRILLLVNLNQLDDRGLKYYLQLNLKLQSENDIFQGFSDILVSRGSPTKISCSLG